MVLPLDLQEKINELYSKINKKILVSSRQELTEKYQAKNENGKSLIKSEVDGIVYAIARMPSTYSVIYTLIENLMRQGFIKDINSVFDVGSGTGAGYFAIKELFQNVGIELFEREKNMIDVFSALSENYPVCTFDLIKDNFKKKADMVVCSYVLSEMGEEARIDSVKKMIEASDKYVLLIDTGTPRTYENYLRIKKCVNNLGWHVIAPCGTEKCGLKNDYCQFYVRVERSMLQKMSKDATLAYEDEKYFYLLLSKDENDNCFDRVIRRPIIKTNVTTLKLCGKSGVHEINITKKFKQLYKQAKKIKINELIDICELGDKEENK